MEVKYRLILGACLALLLFVTYNSITQVRVIAVEEEVQARTGKFIQIADASWGLNCAGRREYRDNEDGESEEHIVKVRKNNALRILTALCNGKEQCKFTADSYSMGESPSKKCTAELDFSYRCFRIDKKHYEKFREGEKVLIDCIVKDEDY